MIWISQLFYDLVSFNKSLEESVVLITRIFDNRVKAFLAEIIHGKGKDKVPFAIHSYRIEFQARPGRAMIQAPRSRAAHSKSSSHGDQGFEAVKTCARCTWVTRTLPKPRRARAEAS